MVSRLLFFLFLTGAVSLFAQNKGLELLHADRHVGKKVGQELLRIFEGNVHFRQDTIQMWCQRAVMHEQKKKIHFEDQVKITNGRSTIRAERIEYFWETRQSYCYNQVQIKTEEDSLYANYLEYNFKSGQVRARDQVYLFNKKNLTHIRGYEGFYNPDHK